MANLRSTIDTLAAKFAASIIEALRSASIDELLEVSHGRRPRQDAEPPPARAKRAKGRRLGRRSAGDIEKMIENIVALLQKSPEGLRAEQIRAALDCESKELPRPLADAVSDGRITKTGQKRATTYFAGSGGGSTGRRARGRKKR